MADKAGDIAIDPDWSHEAFLDYMEGLLPLPAQYFRDNGPSKKARGDTYPVYTQLEAKGGNLQPVMDETLQGKEVLGRLPSKNGWSNKFVFLSEFLYFFFISLVSLSYG